MSLPASVIKAMVAAGASGEVIVAACTAFEIVTQDQTAAADARRVAKRKADRERLAVRRAAERSASVKLVADGNLSQRVAASRGDSCDIVRLAATPSAPSSSPPTPPLITTPPPDGGDGGGGDASASGDKSIAALAVELTDQVGVILGVGTGPDTPIGWCGAELWFQAGLASGWKPEIVRIAARKVRAAKRDGAPSTFRYLGKPIAREHELAAVPMPGCSSNPTIQGGSHAERPRGVGAVLRELREQATASQGSLHLPPMRTVGGS